MTDPAEKLADVAEDAIKRADAAEAQLKDPEALRARLGEVEAQKADDARRHIAEQIEADSDAFNDAWDGKDPELMKRFAEMNGEVVA
jgi:hypothetical protein